MKPYLKYALVTSAILIIWALVQYITGLDRSDAAKYLNWPNYVIMGIFVTLAMVEERKLRGGFILYGEAFKTGFLMMLVVAVIMSIFTFVYFTYINSEFLTFAADNAREEMERQGSLDDDQIDTAMGFTEMFMSANAMTALALVGNIIMGAIFSLIIAAFVKKEPPAQI